MVQNQRAKSTMMLSTSHELTQYLERLPQNIDLRFPSSTALDKSFSDIFIILHPRHGHVLLTTYFRNKAYIVDDAEVCIESTYNVAHRGIQKETGLLPLEFEILDEPVLVENTKDSRAGMFAKWIVIVTKFKGRPRSPKQMLSEKNGELVWVAQHLLHEIFLNHERDESYPQREVVKKFINTNIDGLLKKRDYEER